MTFHPFCFNSPGDFSDFQRKTAPKFRCFRSTFQVLISHAGWSWEPLDRESTLVMLVGMIHIYIYVYTYNIYIYIYNVCKSQEYCRYSRYGQNVSFWRVSMRKNRVTTAFSWSSLGKGCISPFFGEAKPHLRLRRFINVNPGLINPVYGCLIGRVP